MLRKNLAASSLARIAASFLISLSTLSLASGAGLRPAADTTAPAAPQEREAVAQKFVEAKLRVWQERMNLTDWHIQVNLVRPRALEPKTLGNIHWDTDTKQATIGVLSSYDYKLPFSEMLNDMEFTVVHELVHLDLASMPRSDASRRVEEHAVNELAGALLKLAKQQSISR
jgi:hypothetical protein